MKLTAKEWKDLDNDASWNGDWYVEGGLFKVNGTLIDDEEWPDKDALADADIVTIVGGDICCVPGCEAKPKQKTYEGWLKNLLKQRDTTIFVVECSKDQVIELQKLIRANGGEVI